MNIRAIKTTVTSLLVVAGLISPSAFAKSVSHARAGGTHMRTSQTAQSKTAARPKAHKPSHSKNSAKVAKSGIKRKTSKKTSRKTAGTKARGTKNRGQKTASRNQAPSPVGKRNHRPLSPKAIGKVQVPKGLAKGKKTNPMNQTPQS